MGMSQNGLDFGTIDKAIARHGVIKGFDAEAISCSVESLSPSIP